MQTPPNLPYQAYRSKRHSRNISANSQQQPQQQLPPNVSPPPPSRPPSSLLPNGYGLPNGNASENINGSTNANGSAVAHGLNEPTAPFRSFGVNGNGGRQTHHRRDSDRKTNGHFSNESGSGVKTVPVDERRRSLAMADVPTQLQLESKRTTPPLAVSPVPVHAVPALKISMPGDVSPASPSPASSASSSSSSHLQVNVVPAPILSSVSSSPNITVSSPAEIDGSTPLPQSSMRSDPPTEAEDAVAGPSSISASPSTSSSASTSSTTPTNSPRPARRTTTFRHVPLRTARAPHPSSPLRPAATLAPAHHRASSSLSAAHRAASPSPARSTNVSDAQVRAWAQSLGLKTPEMHALRVSDPPSRVSSLMSTPLIAPTALAAGAAERELPAVPALELSAGTQGASRPPSAHSRPTSAHARPAPTPEPIIHNPPPRASSLAVLPPSAILAQSQSHAQPPPTHPSRASTTPASGSPSPSPSTPTSSSRTPAPYRPGFQPKGVYRPRTDEFIELRRTRRDDGRVERTRLERRLEKLIKLHFPHPDAQREREKERSEGAYGGKGKEVTNGNGKVNAGGRVMAQNRRASSFFDLDLSSLRAKSASELWKGVLQTQSAGGKGDIRAAEQVITPWEDDAAVSQCPLCSSSFHPITNRKHHCRLCGRIICSLPVKYPQRPQTCSLLFVADPLTSEIEEVGEGVDYGVRRRTSSTIQPNGKGKTRDDFTGLSDDEKFLRGVRICRDCRPVLLHKEHIQEVRRIPLFTRLYDALVALEKEIEDALPQFQELVISIAHDERPSPEASAARKRLLEAFAQYDALAKRIRKLPCPGGPGSSHDRVQQAIVTRANIFLQKHMFPLQALPKPKKHSPSSTPSPGAVDVGGKAQAQIDPDSELASALQPLLEQEALLESFVEEAKARRKFEDVQTLKANLTEIRAEIDRILANADGHLSESRPPPGSKGKKP